jgi:hypothetical protein
MPKNSNKKWSPEEDGRLLELHAAGKPQALIGVALGRSTGSIVGRLGVQRGLPKSAMPGRVTAFNDGRRTVVMSLGF